MAITARASRPIVLIATLSICVAVKVHRRWIGEQVTYVLSTILEAKKEKPAIAAETAILDFQDQVILQPNERPNHTHPRSAAYRAVAVAFIRQFALTLGASEYALSQSRGDQSRGVAGQRLYYWGKDVDKKVVNDSIGGLVSMVDVDFHLDDLGVLLTGRDHPVVISTINPTKVAKSCGEATYFFNESNEIVMRYSGGACYRHKLWDYTPDTLSTARRVFGVPYQRTLFKVEKRQLNDLRTVVCLAPQGTWSGVWAVLSGVLQQTPLRRLRPVHNGWSHLIVSEKARITHSLGKCGTYSEASFTGAEFEDVVSAAEQSKHDATVSMMASWLGQDRGRALVAASYCRAKLKRKPAYVTSVIDSVQHISSNVTDHGDDGEEATSVTGFMAPLVTGACFAHYNSRSNARWGVKARITGLAKKTDHLTAFPLQCIDEFVRAIAKDGPLSKVSYDEVFAAQSRPTQRTLLEEGGVSGDVTDPIIRSFLKKEPVQGIKDPRVISTIEPRSKLEYSCYMRALGTHLKEFEWYGFKRPDEIAARVAAMMEDVPYALEGDFSRMDGNVDSNVRNVFERSLLRALFPGDDYVITLHKEQFNQQGSIRGHKYDGGFARASGSPETSVFNTLLTAFVTFYKNRLLGLSPAEAFGCIGIAGGDDSLVPGISGVDPAADARAFERAAKGMGQVLKSGIKLPGTPVVFLSRVFGGAFAGDPNSMASPLRVLAKIHCTANMVPGVKAEDKCHEKGFALSLTDPETPILGDLARKMMQVGKRIDEKHLDRASSWWVQFEGHSWPNTAADWMEDVIEAELGEFDREKFDSWVKDGDTMAAPTCLDVPVQPGKTSVIIGDNNVVGTVSEDSASQCLSGFALEKDCEVTVPKSVKSKRSSKSPADARKRKTPAPRKKGARTGQKGRPLTPPREEDSGVEETKLSGPPKRAGKSKSEKAGRVGGACSPGPAKTRRSKHSPTTTA